MNRPPLAALLEVWLLHVQQHPPTDPTANDQLLCLRVDAILLATQAPDTFTKHRSATKLCPSARQSIGRIQDLMECFLCHSTAEGQPSSTLVVAAQAHRCTLLQVACQQQGRIYPMIQQQPSTALSITGVRKSNAQQISKSAEAVTSGRNNRPTSRMCSARVHVCST